MRGGNKVHARADNRMLALCGASSQHGLMYSIGTFNDGGPDLSVTCKNCIVLIDQFNANKRSGVT